MSSSSANRSTTSTASSSKSLLLIKTLGMDTKVRGRLTMELLEWISVNQKNLVTATFKFPGVPKEDIQIDVHDGKLMAVRVRRFGKFLRTLQLPQGIKDEEVKDSMENGERSPTNCPFPKSAPKSAPKKIAVSQKNVRDFQDLSIP